MEQYWLAFQHIPNIGAARLRQIHAYFGDMERAWHAPIGEFQAAGLPTPAIESLAHTRSTIQPEKLLEDVLTLGGQVFPFTHEAYPPLLREVGDAPALLYVKGELLPDDVKAVAVVGTRRASAYGKEMTRRLVNGLVSAGLTVISGLAHGVDSFAHQTALAGGGRTLAVLGTGIDRIYPSENRQLAEQILERGALISEFPPGTAPERGNFPARNRLISGLSLGVVVIEAPRGSGALSTADWALEQGRDVFAVPGNATSPNSIGTNLLIQDGAKLVMEAEDILRELNLTYEIRTVRQTVTEFAPATPLEAALLDALAVDNYHVDELARLCQLPIQDINQALVLMELKGMVWQIAPMTYSASR